MSNTPVDSELTKAIQSLTTWLEEKFLGPEMVAVVAEQSKIRINVYRRKTMLRVKRLQIKEYMGYEVEYKHTGFPPGWSESRKRGPMPIDLSEWYRNSSQ